MQNKATIEGGKFLGIVIDNNLTFNSNVIYFIKIVTRVIWFFGRIRTKLCAKIAVYG